MTASHSTPYLQDVLLAERAELGITVDQLALHSGISVDQIVKIEMGMDWPPNDVRRALELALVLSPGALGDDEAEANTACALLCDAGF
jgi:transcriptional regulator with XRE-family HTH domain